jgi:hypothetical protein
MVVFREDVSGSFALLDDFNFDDGEIVAGYFGDLEFGEEEFGLEFKRGKGVKLFEDVGLAFGFELGDEGVDGGVVPEEMVVKVGDFEGFGELDLLGGQVEEFDGFDLFDEGGGVVVFFCEVDGHQGWEVSVECYFPSGVVLKVFLVIGFLCL